MFAPTTPQKRSCPRPVPDAPLAELSPLPCLALASHRKNARLELLQSPLPTSRDLFSQLLATEVKTTHEWSCLQCETMEEESSEQSSPSYRDDPEESESNIDEEMEDESSSSCIKKRRRKSSGQIKLLKQELVQEPNWSKEKVEEMSDLTGLSQSQVYKWWWDQKKKSPRTEKDNLAKLIMKRKLIHKDLSSRCNGSTARQDPQYSIEEWALATKLKANIELEQLPETERKINKRLIFS